MMGDRRSASISNDGLYRYTLLREWGEGEHVVWMMLNPSTADAYEDDATIRRCIGFSQRWGYGGLRVVNLYALRSTSAKAMLANPHRVTGAHRANRDNVIAEADGRDVVFAWGANVSKTQVYVNELASRVQEVARSVTCLGVTKDGFPRHPVRLANDTERVPYPVPR